MAPNTSNIGLGGWDVFRSGNDFGPLPTAVFALNGTGANITIGSGLYSYLFANYSYDTGNGGEFFSSEVWYIGNLSGDITIPPHTRRAGNSLCL